VRCPSLQQFQPVLHHRLPYSSQHSEVFVDDLDLSILSAGHSKRLLSHIGGRVALRRAWSILPGEYIKPGDIIGKSIHGAPLLPRGLQASISHKHDLAAAFVSSADPSVSIGVDLEYRRNTAYEKLFSRLLTKEEQQEIRMMKREDTELDEEAQVLLRFSFKEAVYKALHPWLCRYIGFQECSVRPRKDGSAEIDLIMNERDNLGLHCEGSWRIHNDYFLTTVRVQKAS
jgi:4'-phosphopantetheinyl transferase EntD